VIILKIKKVISIYILIIFVGLAIGAGGAYAVTILRKAEVTGMRLGATAPQVLEASVDSGPFQEVQASGFQTLNIDLSQEDYLEQHTVQLKASTPLTEFEVRAYNVIRYDENGQPFIPAGLDVCSWNLMPNVADLADSSISVVDLENAGRIVQWADVVSAADPLLSRPLTFDMLLRADLLNQTIWEHSCEWSVVFQEVEV